MAHNGKFGKGVQRRAIEVEGKSEDGVPLGMGVQVAKVTKKLFSVRKMKQAGIMVIFGSNEGDLIVNRKTGSTTKIRDTVSEFLLDIYVPIDEKESGKELGAWSALAKEVRESFPKRQPSRA